MLQKKRKSASVPIKTRMMIYDPYILHAGGANPDDIEWGRRLFITFSSTNLKSGERTDLHESNALNNYRSVEKHTLQKMLKCRIEQDKVSRVPRKKSKIATAPTKQK